MASPTSAGYTDTSVNNTAVYYYVVTALDAGGETADSNQVTGTVILTPLQQWRLVNFGTLNPADPLAGDTADPSGYGISNLMRYALGLPARGSVTGGLPAVGRTGNYLTFEFTRCQAATDITYWVEASNDLNLWTEIWSSGSVPYGGGANPEQQVTVPDTLAISAAPNGRRFLHLKVTNP